MLDISRYAVRVERHELPHLIDKLRAISPLEVQRPSSPLAAHAQADPNPNPNPNTNPKTLP